MTPRLFLSALLIAALAACQETSVAADAQPAAAPAPPAAAEAAPAPDFTLKDLDDNAHTLSEYTKAGKLVVLEWFNPDCPVCRSYYTPEPRMGRTFARVKGDDLVWLAINSGAPGRQGAGQERNVQAATDWDLPYPLLLDESGEVGHAYGAKTTPHMFVIDADGNLRYDGAIDDSRRGGEPTVNYVEQALAELRAGDPVSVPLTRPFGCSVKYAD